MTATDPTNERLVEEGLRADFPSHAIVGEEQAALDGRVPGIDASVPTWFIDPVDGTQNFVHALLLSVVAIGLCVTEPHAEAPKCPAHSMMMIDS